MASLDPRHRTSQAPLRRLGVNLDRHGRRPGAAGLLSIAVNGGTSSERQRDGVETRHLVAVQQIPPSGHNRL